MNNLMGPILAIVVTVLFLLLREFILSVGKKNREIYGAHDQRPSVSVSDIRLEQSLGADPMRGSDESVPEAASLAVDEVFVELRAKAQEQSPSSGTTSGSATDLGRAQSNRKEMAGDLS